MPRIIGGDFTFVTNNASDFRRLYTQQPLHADLVIIVPQVTLHSSQWLGRHACEGQFDCLLRWREVEVGIGNPEESASAIGDPHLNRVATARIDPGRIVVEREGEGHLPSLGGSLDLGDDRCGLFLD